MAWKPPTYRKGEVEFTLTDRLREIVYMVAYTAYPPRPATLLEPEEGGIEPDGWDVVAIAFLDREGCWLGGYSLAANTLTEKEAEAICSHYEADFSRASDEILSLIQEDLDPPYPL